MADAQNPIPTPQPGDSDDVELALETAQRLYKNGDHAEALKWLRRAANSAEEAGDDMRQLQLARVAADIAAELSAGSQVITSAPSLKPSASPGGASRLPQPTAKQPPPAPSARGSAASSSTASSKPSSVAPAAGGPPPLPSSKARTAAPSAPAPAHSESQAPPPARASESQAPPASATTEVSFKPKTAEPAALGAVAAAKPSAAQATSVTPTNADKPSQNASSGFTDGGALRDAVRVSVRVSARDENLMIVRPLAQGQRVPPGAREARLVFD